MVGWGSAGIEVQVEFSTAGSQGHALDEHGQTLGEKLLKYSGKAVGLPADAAHNHDHYLYGSPR